VLGQPVAGEGVRRNGRGANGGSLRYVGCRVAHQPRGESVEETLLVSAARGGNDRAFTVLVKLHERRLYCTALSLMGSSWDAADAVQDAFLEAYLKIDTLRDEAKFTPWLTRILVNHCLDLARARARAVPTDVDLLPEGEAHVFVGKEIGLDVMNAVRHLDVEHRLVIALRYFQDLKVDELAAILDVPSGTVKSRLNRALAKLSLRLGRSSQLEVLE